MTPSADLRVLFRIAAGPRHGFGHLVRSLSLARVMGVRPLLCVRGPEHAADAALALGADLLTDGAPRSVALLRPDVVVVDDPVASAARQWVAAARRAGAIVVTIHDLGIGCPDGDAVIDGRVLRPATPRRVGTAFSGTRYAILDPALPGAHHRGPSRGVPVALGGGPRRRTAMVVAKAIAAADPRAEIRIASGLADELARATVAVGGGGVASYETCAIGGPTAGIPVVPRQQQPVPAFGRQGAAAGMPVKAPGRSTAAVVALADDPHRRARLRRRSMRLIDGRGATRAAAAVLLFVQRKRS